MGIAGAMLVDDEGRVQITPGIRERIYFEPRGEDKQASPEIHISAPL